VKHAHHLRELHTQIRKKTKSHKSFREKLQINLELTQLSAHMVLLTFDCHPHHKKYFLPTTDSHERHINCKYLHLTLTANGSLQQPHFSLSDRTLSTDDRFSGQDVETSSDQQFPRRDKSQPGSDNLAADS